MTRFLAACFCALIFLPWRHPLKPGIAGRRRRNQIRCAVDFAVRSGVTRSGGQGDRTHLDASRCPGPLSSRRLPGPGLLWMRRFGARVRPIGSLPVALALVQVSKGRPGRRNGGRPLSPRLRA